METVQLVINATNLRLEVYANGIPIKFLMPKDTKSSVQIPINEHLLSGDNKISVIINAGLTPSTVFNSWVKSEEDGVNYAQTSSLNFVVQRTGSEGTTVKITDGQWRGTPDSFPKVIRKTFSINTPVHKWAWLDCVELRMDRDFPQASEYIQRIYMALQQGQGTSFAKLTNLKFSEASIAYGMDMSSMKEYLVKLIEEKSKDEEWQLKPLSGELLDIRLVADNRLIECRRKDWSYLFEYVKPSTNETFFLPIMIGKQHNSWHVFR